MPAGRLRGVLDHVAPMAGAAVFSAGGGEYRRDETNAGQNNQRHPESHKRGAHYWRALAWRSATVAGLSPA